MRGEEAEKHLQLVGRFLEVFCSRKHGTREGLCPECAELAAYARDRLLKCPLHPKPKCKDCAVHCYDRAHRDRMKEVMRFSGMHFVKRGRLDWLLRYFLS